MIYLAAALLFLLAVYGRTLAEQWRSYRHKKRLADKIPGKDGIPVFGNVFEFGGSAETAAKMLLCKAKEARDEWDGEILKMWMVHQCFFYPFTGEMLQSILESKVELDKGRDYDIFEGWLGRGLLLAGGEKWRARRRLLTPTFHFNMLVNYVDTMNTHAKVLVEVLQQRAADGKIFDICPLMKRCTLDVICDTAMGKDLDSLQHPDQPYVTSIAKLMHLGNDVFMKPNLWTETGRRLFGWQREYEDNVSVAHGFTIEVIEERIASISRGDVDPNKKAFLDMLIAEKDREHLSMEDIREEVDTFMFAGHDTTSTSLGWTIWCLAHHQEIQERIYQELKEVFDGDMERDCTKDDLASLPYLERCIKESMRIFPPVPFAIRHVANDLQMGPHVIPAGSSMMISPYAVHRNERIYPQPEVYDPDRFLPENAAGRHPYAYIPFSAGPRNCIGQKFAMYLLKIVLAAVLRRYRFSATGDFNAIPKLAEVVLQAGGGVNVKIEARA